MGPWRPNRRSLGWGRGGGLNALGTGPPLSALKTPLWELGMRLSRQQCLPSVTSHSHCSGALPGSKIVTGQYNSVVTLHCVFCAFLRVYLCSRLYIPPGQGPHLSCSSVCVPLLALPHQDGVRKTTGEVLKNVKQINEWSTIDEHFVGRQCPLFGDESADFYFICSVSKYVLVAYPVPHAVWGTGAQWSLRQTQSCPHRAYILERDK